MLSDGDKVRLVTSRWTSSDTLADQIQKLYDKNLKIYQNQGSWVDSNTAYAKRAKIRANRIFRDQESVINALIANPPQPNFLPTRDTKEAHEQAQLYQAFFLKKYKDRNVKEQLRKGLRNLYYARLIVLKPFWNTKINDFDVRSINPKNIRVSKFSTKEDDSEFCIEEVTDSLMSVIARFPQKKQAIMDKFGFTNEKEAFIQNPELKYLEAWIGNTVYFTYSGMLLGEIQNPTWDWQGVLVSGDEEMQLKQADSKQRRNLLATIRSEQQNRQQPNEQADSEVEDVPADVPTPANYNSYYFNHFDYPRKPYIFATVFNNENTPIGQTDMITQAAPLQEGIDRRKQDIDENASLVNGQVKVDSSVMSKADAQKLRYESRGVIWGKGVQQGVTRETGNPLPNFVYEDMVDSRNEIDNIMAATSAFRGEREGQETKAGRLALRDQSYMNLNELVQVVDYVSYELFNWFYQLAKLHYTERHYAKVVGPERAQIQLELMQDDFEDGTEIRVIEGKTLPEDRQFKYEQAQADADKGRLANVDYLEIAGYENPTALAKNAVVQQLNPPMAAGMTPEEVQAIAPPQQEEKPPSVSVSYKDTPPDAQLQILAKAGIQADPQVLLAEKMAEQRQQKEKDKLEAERTKSKMVKSPVKV